MMLNEPTEPADSRLRVLAISAACHPEDSAESRVGWERVLMASRRHDVTVLCNASVPVEELQQLARTQDAGPRLRFVHVQPRGIAGFCYCKDSLHVLGYRLWHQQVLKEAKRLHAEQPFDLVHQVNYCGYREPGHGWRLKVPFVLGPVGGTQNFPLRYLGVTSPLGGARELARNLVNSFQLRYSRRLRRAVQQQTTLLVATRQAQRDLAQHMGLEGQLELEAGLCRRALPLREQAPLQRPMRLLWTGQLRAWKGLPLLLHAMAQLPADVPCQLRVLGVGSHRQRLGRLAEKLGVAERIEWLGWGPYSQTLPHYRWADLFVFTSLRDTSGAGLLEALAAGTPIVGLNHQGAADIVTSECGVKIPLSHPQQTSQDIASAIAQLHRDPEQWLQLSHAATQRAARYVWQDRDDVLDKVYRTALGQEEPACDSRSRSQRAVQPVSVSPTAGLFEPAQ